ncbi:MAG: DUF6279 family lipoprotein [Curvibacter sp.]
MKNIGFRIIGALLLVLLAGCSALQTGYNNAPSLLYWWLDGYVDFNGEQADPVRESLLSLQAWHRREELPAYAALLQRLQQDGAQDLTPAQACAHLGQVRGHLQRLGMQSAMTLAPLVPTLQPEQLRHLARQLEKHDRKWREEWLDGSPEELLQRRLKRTVSRYEDFYGRLSEAQRALLRQRLLEVGFDARLAWAERQRRQRDLLRVLQEHRQGDRPAHVEAELLAWVQRSFEPPDPAVRAYLGQLFDQGCQTLATLHNSSSPGQRRRLVDKLQGYETDLRALAAAR